MLAILMIIIMQIAKKYVVGTYIGLHHLQWDYNWLSTGI